MVYPEKISEHALRASTRRLEAAADANGVAANFECGSYLRFSLAIDDLGLVVAADIRSNGCGYMLAAANVLSEYVAGRGLPELHGLPTAELSRRISSVLGEPPTERLNCTISAIEALRSAFTNLRSKRIEEFRGEEPLVCTCFGVTEERMVKLINDFSLSKVEDVGDACNAGRGCGSCIMLIEEILTIERRHQQNGV